MPKLIDHDRRREEIAEAIRDHQVVIVAGETGSGKTTQLPKICLELGRGITAMIGHTQPRRIAARSVAERIAHELGTPIGRDGVVGYQVRFTEETGPRTLVKLMTDGILLAEIQSDPMLARYDTIIVDEAHERSLNIDFILGYLARLLPQRPDLKVIITSATIDSARFAEHFGRAVSQVPDVVALIEGRLSTRSGKHNPGSLRAAYMLPDDDLLALVPAIVRWVDVERGALYAHRLLRMLPINRLRPVLVPTAFAWLHEGEMMDYVSWCTFASLFNSLGLDEDLHHMADLALAHTDPDVRTAGKEIIEDFLQD